jgi:hypothetical protein
LVVPCLTSCLHPTSRTVIQLPRLSSRALYLFEIFLLFFWRGGGGGLMSWRFSCILQLHPAPFYSNFLRKLNLYEVCQPDSFAL